MNKALLNKIARFEEKDMARSFPQFRLYRGDGRFDFAPDSNTLYWGGELKTNYGNIFNATIVYPPNYPHAGQIKAYIIELLNSDEQVMHMYVDGHLCLYSNDHGGGGEGVSKETTATTIVAWTAAWLNAWEVYRRTGIWPGR